MLQVDPRRRPRVEDLELLPAAQPAMCQAHAIMNEYKFQQNNASKVRELKAREETVSRKEIELKEFEKRLGDFDSKLKEKETFLLRWSEELKEQQNTMDSTTSRKKDDHTADGEGVVLAEDTGFGNNNTNKYTARQRISMGRVTEEMCLDEDELTRPSSDGCESESSSAVAATAAAAPPSNVFGRGPVPLPYHNHRPISTKTSAGFEIHCDTTTTTTSSSSSSAAGGLFGFAGRAAPVLAKRVPPMAPSNNTSTATAPSHQHYLNKYAVVSNSTTDSSNAQGRVATGAETAKENVGVFGQHMNGPVRSKAHRPVGDVTGHVNHHQHNNNYNNRNDPNVITSPWKKQRGVGLAAKFAEVADTNEPPPPPSTSAAISVDLQSLLGQPTGGHNAAPPRAAATGTTGQYATRFVPSARNR